MLANKVFRVSYDRSIPKSIMGEDSEKGLEQAIARANQWLAENKVHLINIETIVTTTGGGMVSVDQHIAGIRVWYTPVSGAGLPTDSDHQQRQWNPISAEEMQRKIAHPEYSHEKGDDS